MYAFLNNEQGNAIHLAYYSELRAALSLFSGSGLRISMDDGFWIDNSGAKQALPPHKTHMLAWASWQEWVKRPDSKTLLESQVRILPATTLADFGPRLRQFDPGLVLGTWGFDLINLQDDHHSRNRASYNAYWRTRPLKRMTVENLDFARKFSELFLSTGSTSLIFDRALIQYLVHSTIESVAFYDKPYSPEVYQKRQDDELTDIIDFVARQTGADEESLRLSLNANIGKSVFEKAKTQSNDAENVLARSGFLARLAMLSVRKNVEGTLNQSAKTWMMNWLEHCGRWDPNAGIAPQDLEAELSDAISALPESPVLLPLDLWSPSNVSDTSTMSSLHTCIAWGAAA
jgi:hypothetical protein